MQSIPSRRTGETNKSQKELLSQTVTVGDVIRFKHVTEESVWIVTKADAWTIMIKGYERGLTDEHQLSERYYTRATLDSSAWSRVFPGSAQEDLKKQIVDGWKAWTAKCKPAAGEEIGMQYLQKDIQAARDEAARKPAADYIVGTYVVDTDKGKCPASCTPRNPCLGPMCPGRRESWIGYEMWSKRQTGVNSQIEDYPVSEDQLRRYRNCGAVLMSRGELRCARDMACPLFRSK